MKFKIYTFCILVCGGPWLIAQNPVAPSNTTDRIIEGGNLIIEILKVFNGNESDKLKSSKSKEDDCATKNFTNVCFVNRSDHIILVKLKKKESEGEEQELLIDNNGKECCYRITPGVYTYSIGLKADGSENDNLIRKGDILLEVCKDLEIKIK